MFIGQKLLKACKKVIANKQICMNYDDGDEYFYNLINKKKKGTIVAVSCHILSSPFRPVADGNPDSRRREVLEVLVKFVNPSTL